MILKAYIAGLVILGAALLLNLLAHKLHIKTWYDYTKSKKNITQVDILWLYGLYPFLLGVAAAVALMILN